jgi:hypothetical protein
MDPGSRPVLEPLPDLPVETPLDAAPSRSGAKPAAAAPARSSPQGLDDEEAALAFMDPELQLSSSQAASRPAPAAAVVIPVPAAARPNGGEYRSIDQTLEELDALPKSAAVTPSTRPELTLEEIDAAAQAAAAAPRSGSAPSAAPALSPAAVPSPALPELTLEDREVERVLASGSPGADLAPAPLAASGPAPTTATAPPAAATPPAKTAPAAKTRPPAAGAPAAAARPAAPVASSDAAVKRAALSAAAVKLAAASAAGTGRNGNGRVPPSAAPAAPTRAASAAPAAAAPGATAPSASSASAPSLTDWASARAAAATKVVATPAASAPRAATPPTLPAAAPAAAGAPQAPPAAAAAPAVAPSPPMDRDAIARNQVVERYLSGRLPLKGATEFERFCHDHPELLDEIGLPERVNAGLRLLEASGKPEPWHETARPAWQQPMVTIGLAAGVMVLAVALAITTGSSAGKSHRIAELQRQVADRTLDAATGTREIRLLPSRSGASNSPAITVGGGDAQLADFRIDESRSPYHLFRVTIDRVDQGRVGVINNLAKDSNGHLRIALNTSALGPGIYQLTLEGLDWHGDPQPDSWATIAVQH